MRGLLQSLNRRIAAAGESVSITQTPTRPMQVTIKTPSEQEQMRVAGRLAADVLE